MTTPIIVTRGNSPLLQHCLENLAATDPLPRHVVVVCNDDFDNAQTAGAFAGRLPISVLNFHENLDFWGGLNAALPYLADAEPFWYLGKDVEFAPDWLTVAEQAWRVHYPDGLGLLSPQDGIQNEKMAALGMTTKRWLYVVWGTPYFPAPPYKHFYCDPELSNRSRDLGRWLYVPQCKVWHKHQPSGFRNEAEFLAIDAADKELFFQRQYDWPRGGVQRAKRRLAQLEKIIKKGGEPDVYDIAVRDSDDNGQYR